MKACVVISLYIAVATYTGSAHAQTYLVKKVPRDKQGVNITGKGDAVVWSEAHVLTQFTYPWENATAPATSFSALWDGQWLYCLYRVQDDSVITVTKPHIDTKRAIGGSDRVEIFMKANDSMNPYYCLEIDATGRVMDYTAAWYRQMNYTWQWPAQQLKIKSSIIPGGYIVEFAISISSLKQFGLLKDKRLQAGLFRAECTGIVNGRSDMKWISWIKPKSDQPDFHIPSAFGILELE